MLMTGIIGLYIGRIHAEVKRRPLYVVAQQVGFERKTAAAEQTHQFCGANAQQGMAQQGMAREG